MKPHKLLMVGTLALLSAALASCDDDEDRGPATLKQLVVKDVNGRTTDTATPIEINDRAIDASNEDPDQYDDLLQSI
jgi:hypothetical protein